MHLEGIAPRALGFSDEEIKSYAVALARTRAPIRIKHKESEVFIERRMSAVRALNTRTGSLSAVLTCEYAPLGSIEDTPVKHVIGAEIWLYSGGELDVYIPFYAWERARSGEIVFYSKRRIFREADRTAVLGVIEDVARRYAELEEALDAGETVVFKKSGVKLRVVDDVLIIAYTDELFRRASKLLEVPVASELLEQRAVIKISEDRTPKSDIWLAPYTRVPIVNYCCDAFWEPPVVFLRVYAYARECEAYEYYFLIWSRYYRIVPLIEMTQKLEDEGKYYASYYSETNYIVAKSVIPNSFCSTLSAFFRS